MKVFNDDKKFEKLLLVVNNFFDVLQFFYKFYTFYSIWEFTEFNYNDIYLIGPEISK